MLQFDHLIADFAQIKSWHLLHYYFQHLQACYEGTLAVLFSELDHLEHFLLGQGHQVDHHLVAVLDMMVIAVQSRFLNSSINAVQASLN
jgi:hypothetical protein